MGREFDPDHATAAIRRPGALGGEDPDGPDRGSAPARVVDKSAPEFAAHASGAPDVSVAYQAVEFLAGWGRTQQVRRRVLDVQLARLADRLGGADLAARDAAARSVRLASRLERNELAW